MNSQIKQFIDPSNSMFTKSELIDICIKNKYFQVVLVTYYKLTRNKTIAVSINDLKKKDLLRSIAMEYLEFLSGASVQISTDEDDTTFNYDSNFKIPTNLPKKDEALFLQELIKVQNNTNHDGLL